MALIKCPDCGSDVSDLAPTCPKCGRPLAVQTVQQSAVAPPTKKKTSPLAKGCLVVLLGVGGLLVLGIMMISSSHPGGNSTSPVGSAGRQTGGVEGPALELVNSSWHEESGYAIFEGQVKNISSSPLENVEAVVSFYDGGGGFITSSDALIDFNPILPGQTSPFKVMKTENPAMKKAGVEFKHLMGGSIRYRNKAPGGHTGK